MEAEKTHNKFRMGIREVEVLIIMIPMLVVCIILAYFAALTMRTGLEDQVFKTLKAMATSVESALDEIDDGDYNFDGEKLYKGKYCVTDHIDMLDAIADTNSAELTIFIGDTRRATTITNQSGERIVGTTVSSTISSKVLGGEEYESSDAVVNDENYYGFYMPLKNNTGTIVGIVFAGRESATIDRYIQTRVNFIIIVAVIAGILFTASGIWVSHKKVLEPIRKLSKVAVKLAEGDVNQKVERESNDEFGDLMEDFAEMVSNISSQAHIAQQVSQGDLTVECKPVSDKDVMGKALKKMLADNNKNMSIIRDAAARMASGAGEVASASNSLAQGTTEQASAIQQITASIEEISNGAKINADDANSANDLVQSTRDGAVRGNEQMKKMIEAMNDINESSENISKIMKVIDDIAFQTNILALNASVEAARAGVHGKGFAVVADEVRNLASKSAEAAKDSAEMIEDSIRKVEVGSKLAQETATALEEISESVEKIASLVGHIATASANQAVSVGQVNTGISQIADVVQTNSATSEECAAASAELSSLAGQLTAAVNRYKLLSGRSRSEDDFGADDVAPAYQDNESIISLGDDFGKY